MTWFRFDPDAGVLTLQVMVQPGAKLPGASLHGNDLLRIRVSAPAVDGRANEALCSWVASRLGVAKTSVNVVRGATSRRKSVQVRVEQFNPGLLLPDLDMSRRRATKD